MRLFARKTGRKYNRNHPHPQRERRSPIDTVLLKSRLYSCFKKCHATGHDPQRDGGLRLRTGSRQQRGSNVIRAKDGEIQSEESNRNGFHGIVSIQYNTSGECKEFGNVA